MIQQINIAGLELPETSHDRYSCPEAELSVQVDMISGRRVIEQRGKVWKPSYAYDYMGDSLTRALLPVLRSGAPVLARVRTDTGEQVTAQFVVESLTPPKVLAFDGVEPIWHGLAFVLREERPHD